MDRWPDLRCEVGIKDFSIARGTLRIRVLLWCTNTEVTPFLRITWDVSPNNN